MSATSQAVERLDGSPRALVSQYESSFAAVLPSHITKPETWIRLAQGALKKGRISQGSGGRTELEVAAANNPGVFLATLLDCARLGLEPGTEQYYLTPRKVSGRLEILGIIGYQGIVELMYRAGAISSVVAECVHANDQFEYSPGRHERPVHEIDWDAEDRGALRLVYAYAVMKDGATSKVVVLNRSAIGRIKAKSQGADTQYSPWQTDEPAMWLKSAVRQLRKWVPTSAEYIREQLRAARDVADEAGVAGPVEIPNLPSAFDEDDVEDRPFDDDDVIEAEIVESPAGVDTATGEVTGERAMPDEPMTDAQSRALHALLRSRHNAAGPARFPVLTGLLGREITTTKEISKDEASRLIDRLQDDAPGHDDKDAA